MVQARAVGVVAHGSVREEEANAEAALALLLLHAGPHTRPETIKNWILLRQQPSQTAQQVAGRQDAPCSGSCYELHLRTAGRSVARVELGDWLGSVESLAGGSDARSAR